MGMTVAKASRRVRRWIWLPTFADHMENFSRKLTFSSVSSDIFLPFTLGVSPILKAAGRPSCLVRPRCGKLRPGRYDSKTTWLLATRRSQSALFL